MMKNQPHDVSQLCMPTPADDKGRLLTYEEIVIAMRAALGKSVQGDITQMELEPR